MHTVLKTEVKTKTIECLKKNNGGLHVVLGVKSNIKRLHKNTVLFSKDVLTPTMADVQTTNSAYMYTVCMYTCIYMYMCVYMCNHIHVYTYMVIPKSYRYKEHSSMKQEKCLKYLSFNSIG